MHWEVFVFFHVFIQARKSAIWQNFIGSNVAIKCSWLWGFVNTFRNCIKLCKRFRNCFQIPASTVGTPACSRWLLANHLMLWCVCSAFPVCVMNLSNMKWRGLKKSLLDGKFIPNVQVPNGGNIFRRSIDMGFATYTKCLIDYIPIDSGGTGVDRIQIFQIVGVDNMIRQKRHWKPWERRISGVTKFWFLFIQ